MSQHNRTVLFLYCPQSYRSSPEAEIMYLNRATPGASLIVAGSLLLLSAVLGFVGARNVSWPWLCVVSMPVHVHNY